MTGHRKTSGAPSTLTALAEDRSSDPLDHLYALRRRVAEALDETASSREVAALARQYAQLTADIAEAEAAHV
jgi:hypothetical protein